MRNKKSHASFQIIALLCCLMAALAGCGRFQVALQPKTETADKARTEYPGSATPTHESDQATLEGIPPIAGGGKPVRRTIEQAGEMIAAYLSRQKPGSMELPPLTIEEVPAERVWNELQGQIFRVTQGVFRNEAFLLRLDSIIQLGETSGGQGLTSLVVSDLDRDGQPELVFSYNTGLGPAFGSGAQTRLGLFSPAYDETHLIEANLAYLGTAGLRFEGPDELSFVAIEANEATKTLPYLDRLGQIAVENSQAGVSLTLNVDPDLPHEQKQKILVGK